MGVMKRLNTKQVLSGKRNGITLMMETRRVLNAVDDKRRKVLYQTAGYARTTMSRSMRNARKKHVPEPGKPPRTHRTKNGHAGALRRLIGFHVFEKEGSFVVGPSIAEFKSSTVPVVAKTVPELLDKGGPAVDRKGRTVYYRAFPFVAPAFDKALEKFKDRIEHLPLIARS